MPSGNTTPNTSGCWLVKSEKDVYSIQDLERDGTTPWDGVRNYQARNMMRDEMRKGDRVLFYHSNTSPVGVVGVAEVASAPYPDPTQFDPDSPYYDRKSKAYDPTWILVDLRFVERFPRLLQLNELRNEAELAGMALIQPGQRLSIQPVSRDEFDHIVAMARRA